jgi:hypothetical protein
MWEDNNEPMNTFVSQVNTLKAAGGDVIISFGGASGGELAQTCTSVTSLTAAYKNVVTTYGITRLDFDIEGDPLDDTASISRRNQALAALQASMPSVEVDYTVPVDPNGIESNVISLLNDAKSKGVKVSLVNIMTMDFGDGENALNDAESAANGLHSQLGSIYPGLSSAQLWNLEGLTVIAGKNDDNENFTQANAVTLETFAASKGVQELSFWEVHDYDRATGYKYSATFNKITGGTTTSPSPTPSTSPSGGGGGATRYEAENATISQGILETTHTGFSGTGYVNADNVAGSYVEFTVNADTAGTATIGIRYANGTAVDRPASISANGTVINASLSFPATTNWDTWATKTITAPVTAGANKIRITGTTANGPANLDYLDVTITAGGGGGSTRYEAETATIVQGAVATNHTGFTGTGFVDYTNVTGSYVEFAVTATAAGSVTLTVRYANGTTVNRPMDITVNGTVVSAGHAFASTGTWDTWQTATLTIAVTAGTNTIRATATTANGGPNLDSITITT